MLIGIKCQWEQEVSDAEFGYWNQKWGTPGVAVLTCYEPAEVAVHTSPDLPEYDEMMMVCMAHAERGALE